MASYPKKGVKTGAKLAFLDESGISEKPTVRRSWAPKGKTPIINSPGHWHTHSVTGAIVCTARGYNPKLYFRLTDGVVASPEFIRFVKQLRHHVRGRIILLMDRLAVHRSKESSAFLKTQQHWLKAEWFPPYAPELNPIEYLWSASKRKDFANFCPDTISDLDNRIRRSVKRIRRRPDILTGFLRKSSLFP